MGLHFGQIYREKPNSVEVCTRRPSFVHTHLITSCFTLLPGPRRWERKVMVGMGCFPPITGCVITTGHRSRPLQVKD